MKISGHTVTWWEAIGVLALVGATFAAISMIEPESAGPSKTVNADACVTSDDGFRTVDGVAGFQVVLKNSCEVKVRCTVFVNVTNSRGSNTGQQTLLLSAAAPGQFSQKSWMFNTGSASGMASLSRECKGA